MPKMTNTEQAIALGKRLDEHSARGLAHMRALYRSMTHEHIQRGELDEAIRTAYEAQLCREALQAGPWWDKLKAMGVINE